MKFHHEPTRFSHEPMEKKLDKSFHHKIPQRDLHREVFSFHIEKDAPSAPPQVFEREHYKMVDPGKRDTVKPVYEWDHFQLADPDFVRWINTHAGDPMVLAVMAEMKQSPPVKDSVETCRAKVKDVSLCSVEEYRKTKMLGEGSVAFLKDMKKKYGNNLLRFLRVTL